MDSLRFIPKGEVALMQAEPVTKEAMAKAPSPVQHHRGLR